MCVRYTLRKPRLADVADALKAEFSPEDEAAYKPHYNGTPIDLGWIVIYRANRRVLRPAQWRYLIGRDHVLVTIQHETVAFGQFRNSFETSRCALVTDGFYKWGADGLPVWFHAPKDELVLLGGLVQFSDVAESPPRFSVLTTKPNTLVAPLHDRMPVIIAESQLDEWLTGDPAVASAMLNPAPNGALVATKVSKHVNSVKNDSPACIEKRGAIG